MAAVPRVANQPAVPAVQAQSAPAEQNSLINKIKEVVLSRWALVVATAVLAGACFGVMVGLAAAAVGAMIAAFAFKSQVVPVPPGTVQPAPVAQIPGDPNSREYNVGIFNQTLAMIAEGVRINPEQHRQSIAGARVVPEIAGQVNVPGARVATRFIVEPITTYAMTRRLVQEGHRPLVLDMANRYERGGAVRTGARAQEETVCRQSTLYPALERLEYPLPERGGALVPGVQFFRDDAYNVVEPFAADVFVSAAYNCNRAHGAGYDRPGPEEVDMFYEIGTDAKIMTMLRAAIQNGNRSVVLSAFGCGAFRNDPNFIARTYRRILDMPEFRGAFDVVAFGIYDPPGAQHPNCPIFQEFFAHA
jgi:uncharacterized protein (TIGR02452 family)